MSNIQFVILAGGLGTRLYPISKNIPKPLVDVCGKPFLAYLVEHILEMGFSNITILSGYLAEHIDNFCSRYEPKIKNIIEGQPLGTGGAIRAALNSIDDRFVLMNGDTFIPEINREKIMSIWNGERQYIFSCSPKLVDESPNLQVGENNRIIFYGKSHESIGVDSGVYVFNKKYFKIFKNFQKFSLSEVYKKMIDDRNLYVVNLQNKYYDIGTPDRLKIFQKYIMGK